jgi:TPR repeat protein
MANPSDTPGPAPAAPPDKGATASPAKADKPATMAPPPKAQEAPVNPEAARLMARAKQLVSQGNVGAARNVLERAADSGSASALFALAETYDPAVLSSWGTVGTQGDAAKARELYGKAVAGGSEEAKDRLKAMP